MSIARRAAHLLASKAETGREEDEDEDASGASLGDAGAGKGRQFNVEKWHDGMEEEEMRKK
jgi:hypothetical protein